MKYLRSLALTVITLAASAVAFAAKPIPGPKGGRILTTEAPHAEFFVAKDHSVVVTFYGADLKALPVSGQVVTATAETKAGKVKLDFAEKDGALVSKSPMPEGDDFTVVVQIKDNASARPKNYRVLYHDEICAECKRAEYACICDDQGGEKEKGHNH
mgnify:CR=1 FL=1|jgi:hypothetical protein